MSEVLESRMPSDQEIFADVFSRAIKLVFLNESDKRMKSKAYRYIMGIEPKGIFSEIRNSFRNIPPLAFGFDRTQRYEVKLDMVKRCLTNYLPDWMAEKHKQEIDKFFMDMKLLS